MKQTHKRIFGVVFAIICCFTLTSCLDVNAKPGEYCTATKAKSRYKPTAVNDEKGNIKISIAKGDFLVKVTGSLNDQIYYLNEKNKSITVKYNNKAADAFIEVAFILNASDDLCLKGSGNDIKVHSQLRDKYNVSEGSYIHVETFSIGGDYVGQKTSNTSYNTICKAFREGTGYKEYFSGKYGNDTTINKELYEKYNPAVVGSGSYQSIIPYCYQPQVSSNFKDKEVAKMIKNSIDSYRLSIGGGMNGSIDGPRTDVTVIDRTNQSTDLSNEKLTCDPFKLDTSSDYYVNKKYYYKKEESSSSKKLKYSGTMLTCDKACEESVTVEYGPPAATKGGLCFEYKVKVTSKVNCTSKVNGSKPELTTVCTPSPHCNDISDYFQTQGGPTEDFDQCVQNCDDGKYSQSCINKCYKKVYENDKSLSLSYNNKLKVEKMAAAILNDQNTGDAEGLRNAIINEGTGKYYVKNGSIAWKSGNAYWDRIGRYYLLYQPARTVQDIPENGYIIDINGFKRSNSCLEVCSWTGCEEAKNNVFYEGGSHGNSYLNPSDASQAYNSDIEEYNNFARECKAEATCTTKTAEFTIKVNNKTNSNPEEDNWINYDKATITGTSKNDKDNIILDRGGCYGEASDQYDYMTEWSFPGTWVNNKTGEISYKPVSGTAWHKKEKKFCTMLDSKDVNTKWWEWKLVDRSKYTEAEIKSGLEYNIEAAVKDFGFFAWDFKMACFYGLYDNVPIDCTGDSCIECVGDECKTKSGLDYKFRSVDTKDLFPSAEGTTTSANQTGREPGYNWTSAATNLNNEDYEITPGALLHTIQQRGTNVYNDTNNYLDYEFVLDKEAISKIRQYSRSNQKNYTKYDGTIQVINGVATYKSNLFRGANSSKITSNKLGRIGCNNERNGVCETFTDDYVNTVR